MNNKKKEHIGNSNKIASNQSNDNICTTKVEQILNILDVDVEIPDGLVDKVMEKKDSIQFSKHNRFDISKYLQIAVVMIAAVLLGIFLGKNADVSSFYKQESRNDKALLQLKEEHHFSESHSFGRL